MQSGRQALASLDEGLRQIHDNVQDMEHRVKQSSGAMMDLRREQSRRFQRMAQIRLDNVVSGELVEGLDAADKRARELIRQRGQKLGALNRKIKAARAQHRALDEQRTAV